MTRRDCMVMGKKGRGPGQGQRSGSHCGHGRMYGQGIGGQSTGSGASPSIGMKHGIGVRGGSIPWAAATFGSSNPTKARMVNRRRIGTSFGLLRIIGLIWQLDAFGGRRVPRKDPKGLADL